MQNEERNHAFRQFGTVYHKFSEGLCADMVCHTKRITAHGFRNRFLRFDCDVYLEHRSGYGTLLVSYDPLTMPVQSFEMSQFIHIKPNVYFSFDPSTAELVLDIYVTKEYAMDMVPVSFPEEHAPDQMLVRDVRVLSYFYRIRTPNYQFKGERHQFFELTYVDTGTLYTVVDDVTYRVGEKEMIIYGPGQYHSQYTKADQSVSYVTIMFNMKSLSENVAGNWYDVLINKVFPYNKKNHTLIKTLVQESATGVPYTESLMNCLLTETIIRLLQAEYVAPAPNGASIVRQNYQDELFSRIVAYIESKIYEPLTVAEICQKFSLSRSSLQLLFKNAVNQSPKKYISDLKLEKSCQMLRENKYTISEISIKLGYSSIHYFSNAFNQKYHISPSEYAKRIY